MSEQSPAPSCCAALSLADGQERLAGHHPECPRFGLAAIEGRDAEAWEYLSKETAAESSARGNVEASALLDRAVLLAAVKELQAEADRLRPIVEEVAGLDLCENEYPWPCKSCGVEWGNGRGGQNMDAKHRPDCLGERAKVALSPARCQSVRAAAGDAWFGPRR